MELSTFSNSWGTASVQRWKCSSSNKHFKMKNPLAGCTHERVYQDLKGFSKNGDNFCKQLLSILQQRADLENTYAKGLEKLANKLTKVLDKMKVNYICSAWLCVSERMKSASDLHSQLGKAIQTEAVNQTNSILEEHEKRKKALDNTVEKAADVVIRNWRQQMKAKKKLKELTRDHEILFRNTESSQQLASPKTKKKMLRSLEKSAMKLAKDDENYYEKNLAACETRLRWETALENCHQSILNLEKERLGLLCNMLNRYSQHLSSFGQSLIECHTRIHQAVSEIDTEKDIQKLLEEMAMPIAEEKSEFLLTDYYEEDSASLIEKDRRQESIKAKVLRVQKDLEKALQDKTGLERMLQAYTQTPQFSDAQNQKDITEQLDETTLKVGLLQATHYKLASVLAEIEQKPKPRQPWNDCISKWKEKEIQVSWFQWVSLAKAQRCLKLHEHMAMSLIQDCMHSSVLISCPLKMKRSQRTLSMRTAAIEAETNPSSQPAVVTNSKPMTSLHPENGNEHYSTCTALYDYQAKSGEEICLKKGDVIVIQEKEEDGWWYGSLNGKEGIFPATYVEENAASLDETLTIDEGTAL